MDIYFDNAATTRVRDESVAAMNTVMREDYGNPSSSHKAGRRAGGILADARKKVADALGAQPDEIYFTSGGTEADNWAVLGAADVLSRKGRHIVTSLAEHDAVLNTVKELEKKGWSVTYLSPDNIGRISKDDFAAALRDDTVFASIMLVNNETGVVNPIEEYADEIKKRKLTTVLHTDAVQGFCKVPFAVKQLGVELLSVSAHKIHGSKGVGALYIKKGVKLLPLLFGGGQESGKRAGTEALPAIVGFAEAAALGAAELNETTDGVRELREYMIRQLTAELPEVVFIGGVSPQKSQLRGDTLHNVSAAVSSPFILSLSLPGYKGEVLVNYLDGEGVCVSRSAACKKGARSRVLEAMGLRNDIIDGALRVSFSRSNTMEEVDHFVRKLKSAADTLLKAL